MKKIIRSVLAIGGFVATASIGNITEQALAAPAVPVDVSITVDTAPFSIPGSVPRDINGDAVFYDYTGYAPYAITDTIPVTVCIANSSSGPETWTSFDVDWGGASGNLPGVVTPVFHFASTSPNACQTKNITINTGPLVTGQYQANMNIQAGSPILNETAPSGYKLKVLFEPQAIKTLHIGAASLAPQQNVSCFLTDSQGLLLSDCQGNAVSQQGSQDGRFVIVANKKNIEVATNPGQFYYNLIYNNTTSEQKTVHVNFTPLVGVVPNGRQAVHWAVYNNYMTALSAGEWDATNSTGSPDGSDPWVYNIPVRANSHLLVTYHLEWKGTGLAVPPACSTNCPTANQKLSVTGTVYDAAMTVIGDCTATAWGYRK